MAHRRRRPPGTMISAGPVKARIFATVPGSVFALFSGVDARAGQRVSPTCAVGAAVEWIEYEGVRPILGTVNMQLHLPVHPATVDVVVHSSDPVSRMNVVSLLAEDLRVSVLAESDRARADVIVVVAGAVGDATLSWLRTVRDESVLAAKPRCVLVTERIRGTNVLAAVGCGVAAVLPRQGLDPTRLVRAVLSVNRGVARLPLILQGEMLRQLDRMVEAALETTGPDCITAEERDLLQSLANELGIGQSAGEDTDSYCVVRDILGRRIRPLLATRDRGSHRSSTVPVHELTTVHHRGHQGSSRVMPSHGLSPA